MMLRALLPGQLARNAFAVSALPAMRPNLILLADPTSAAGRSPVSPIRPGRAIPTRDIELRRAA